jgi:hypothetical protein
LNVDRYLSLSGVKISVAWVFYFANNKLAVPFLFFIIVSELDKPSVLILVLILF